MLEILAQAPQAPFDTPTIDWHAFAPFLVLAGTIIVVLLVDVIGLKNA